MSYYTPRFHLMVSSRQEDLKHPLSISLGRFPGFPLAFPKVHRACQQHSWDKVQPFPRALLGSDLPWGVLQNSVELHGHVFAKLKGIHICCWRDSCLWLPGWPQSQPLALFTGTEWHHFWSALLCWGLTAPFWPFFFSCPASSSSALRVIWVLCLWLSGVAQCSCLVSMLSHPCWIIFYCSLWE